MSYTTLRTFTNKVGTFFNALKTTRIYAEDLNLIGENLDDHESRINGISAGGSAEIELTDDTSVALDASLGSVFYLAAGGDREIAVPSNPSSGQKIIIRHFADGAARSLSLNLDAGGFRFGSDITTLTETGSGKSDYIQCVWNATDEFWDVIMYIKGFFTAVGGGNLVVSGFAEGYGLNGEYVYGGDFNGVGWFKNSFNDGRGRYILSEGGAQYEIVDCTGDPPTVDYAHYYYTPGLSGPVGHYTNHNAGWPDGGGDVNWA
jgi:hypothetical protein